MNCNIYIYYPIKWNRLQFRIWKWKKEIELDDHVVPFHTVDVCLAHNDNEKHNSYKSDDGDYVDNEKENARHHPNEKHGDNDNDSTGFLLFGRGIIFTLLIKLEEHSYYNNIDNKCEKYVLELFYVKEGELHGLSK